MSVRSHAMAGMCCGSHPFKDEDEGWSYEGGILWKQSMFELVAHGKEPLSMHMYPRRGLFWARLRVRGTSQTILVTTMHLPWNGTEDELRTGARCATCHLICNVPLPSFSLIVRVGWRGERRHEPPHCYQ